MSNNNLNIDDFFKSTLKDFEIPNNEVTTKAFNKKLAWSNFFSFGFYHFNVYYLSSILVLIGGISYSIIDFNSNIKNNTPESKILIQDSVAEKTSTSKTIIEDTISIKIENKENTIIDNKTQTNISKKLNSNKNNNSENKANSINNSIEPINKTVEKTNAVDTNTVKTKTIVKQVKTKVILTDTVVEKRQIIINKKNKKRN